MPRLTFAQWGRTESGFGRITASTKGTAMVSTETLRTAVFNVVSQANNVAATIDRFRRKNRRRMGECADALRGTNSGVDHDVARGLDEAAHALTEARARMLEAADLAADYGRRI